MKQITNLLKRLRKFTKLTPSISKIYKKALEKDIFGNNPEKKSIYISKTKKPSNPRLVKTGKFKASLKDEIVKSGESNIGFDDDNVKVKTLIKKYKASYYKLSDQEKARISKEITKLTQKLIDNA